MDNFDFQTHMDGPRIRADHPLQPILRKTLNLREAPTNDDLIPRSYYWGQTYFDLQNVEIFRELSHSQKEYLLKLCSRYLLQETYYIEKGGMEFATKMAIHAKSTDERMMYLNFASDEAHHFHWVAPFYEVEGIESHAGHSFICLLNRLVETEEPAVLIYIIQVLLEGWGIYHYGSLARNCEHPGLKRVFEFILRDEARHHGSGVVILNDHRPTPAVIARVTEIMDQFFQMVRVGPMALLHCLQAVAGPLNVTQKTKVLTELNAATVTEGKIQTLIKCIQDVHGSDQILKHLQSKGSLQAFPIEIVAAL